MSGFAKHILGLATGRYGTGTPAKAITPMANHPDPVEIVEEVQHPTAVSTPAMGRNSQLPVTPENASDTALPPKVWQGPELVGTDMQPIVVEPQRQVHIVPKAPAPPSATTARETGPIAEEQPRPNRENLPTPTPFPSYAEARTPSFVLPELDEAAPDRPDPVYPTSAAFQGPARPGLIPSVQPVDEQPAPAAPMPHEPSAAPPVPGLEIGELTISVTPAPELAPVRSAPTSRGSGISASALIRRAGIRRL